MEAATLWLSECGKKADFIPSINLTSFSAAQ